MRRSTDGAKPNLAAWTALLLMGLGSILLGLYVAARLLLSLEGQDGIAVFERARTTWVEAARRDAAREAARPRASTQSVVGTDRAELLGARSGGRPAADSAVHLGFVANRAALHALPPDQKSWSLERIAAYEASLAGANFVPEGVVRIPAVGIEVPVYPGASELNLTRGAGRVEWTPILGSAGNVGIAARRDGFFRPLKDIALGARIFVDLLDRTLRYEVVDIRVVQHEDPGVLAETDEAYLTLITCYPFYFVGSAPKYFVVRAKLSADPLVERAR
jgi:sortase A